MKKYYLFSVRGMTDRFFCGNNVEALPTDMADKMMTYQDCVDDERCKVFNTRKEAVNYAAYEETEMEDSNNYANRAMRNEELYGCEGVDVDY